MCRSSYVRHAVEMANALKPDLIALGGDYPHRGLQYVAPCIYELSRLRAPLGVYAILGNHDHYDGIQPHVSAALRAARHPGTDEPRAVDRSGRRAALAVRSGRLLARHPGPARPRWARRR